jgi:metal-sulfur cluster biosynthetic enzyme
MKIEALRDRIHRALSEVMDPETGLDVTRMDIIHDINVEEAGEVSLVFRPSSPVCPMAYSLASSIKKKLEDIAEVHSVRIRVENFQRADHLETLLNMSNGNH